VAGRPRPSRHARLRAERVKRRRRLAWALIALVLVGIAGTAANYWRQGYRLYVVHTGSMTPTLVPGDLVIDRPAKNLKPGEVITFRHSDLTTDVVTHRVTGVTAAGIHTKGDANRTADVWTIRPDQVKGHVIATLQGFGYLAVYFQQPTGIASVATALIGLLLLYGLFFPSTPEQAAEDDDDTARQPGAQPALA
jgi:signal peptidase